MLDLSSDDIGQGAEPRARAEARTLGRAAHIAEREASRLRADADAADTSVAEAEAALAKLLSRPRPSTTFGEHRLSPTQTATRYR